jgi:F-type H+-transporting ATPase subunit delta
MQENRVAKRYATALFNLALQRNVVEEVEDQLLAVGEAMRDRRLEGFFTQPQIPMADKQRAMARAVGDRAHPLVKSLLELLLRKHRIAQLGAISQYYDLLTDRLRGVEEITVISAVELDDEDYSEILARIIKHSAYTKLRLIKKVQPEILGGFIIELGHDKVIDQSLRSALSLLHRRLVKHRSF